MYLMLTDAADFRADPNWISKGCHHLLYAVWRKLTRNAALFSDTLQFEGNFKCIPTDPTPETPSQVP